MNENIIPPNEITLNLDTLEDQNDGSAQDGLSLRDAIIIANLNRDNQYTINLAAGTYDLDLADGSLPIGTSLTIIGVDAGSTIIDASFLGDRIFDVFFGGNLTLKNVTLQNANTSTGDGGAINIDIGSKATIDNVVIIDNATTTNGGGIANSGTLELNDSVVLSNASTESAGGIYNNGELTINRSTVGFNSTGNIETDENTIGGGGILNDEGGNLTVVNSTISSNISIVGGGIWAKGNNTTVVNSTIAKNQASSGSGIFSENIENAPDSGVNMFLRNSIVADNLNGPDIQGAFNIVTSYNLIGYGAQTNLLNGVNNNQIGTETNPIDPLIEAFPTDFTPSKNSAAELVHVLQPDSPAINVGENAVTEIRSLFTTTDLTDQQNKTRIIDGIVELGSVEYTGDTSGQLDTPIHRFQNTDVPSTYLYTGEEEGLNIKANYPNFTEEGFAFNVGVTPHDDLITMYRFQNLDLPGTYLYAGEAERQSILQNNSNFIPEGIAFYVYGVGSNKGDNIYRFQNLDQPGTYLFVGEQEKQNIINNYSNFVHEGIAFEVSL